MIQDEFMGRTGTCAPLMARSYAELEFRSIAQGICELLWQKIILDDQKIELECPMKFYCDNKSTINIAQNPVEHEKTKFIDRHLIKREIRRRFNLYDL